VAEEQSVAAFKARQGQPVRMTNQIASIARRPGTGGRPPLGRSRSAGISGSSTAHSRSGKRHPSIAQALPRPIATRTRRRF
jgi:hypothetical protein